MLKVFYEVFILLIGFFILITSYNNLYLLICSIIIILVSGIRLYKINKDSKGNKT